MCGIVAYIGLKPTKELLIEGLKRLEYRGYDSAGMAIINVDGPTKDTTSMGPSFAMAVTYEIAPQVALGLENTQYWIWFDSDFRGSVADDTSLRITFNF